MRIRNRRLLRTFVKLLAIFAIGIWLTHNLFGNLSIERLIGGQSIRLLIEGEEGDTWIVEFSDDLREWQNLGEAGVVVLNDSGKGEIVITPTSNAQYYRALLSVNPNSLPSHAELYEENRTAEIMKGVSSIESTSLDKL